MSIIKVYHSSYVSIPEPDVKYGRKNADFGQGFYMSDSLDFALRWSRPRKGRTIIINCYELHTAGLNILRLERDDKWFEYIYSNRYLKPDLYPEADVIIGPIANDTIFDTMGIFTSGYLSKEDVLPLMKLGPEYRQTVLKTEKASGQLKWVKSIEVPDSEATKYENELKREETEYLLALSDAMEKL
jgi:hypothetical protein